MLSKLLGFFTNPFADVIGGWQARKTIAAENAATIATAEVNLKVAKFNAKAQRLNNQATNDADYDMQVLRNRNESLMDNFVIITVFTIWLAHFIPITQPYMASGWKAMGYQGAPWWLEFLIVGIGVSTLGLMRLFRAFWRVKEPIRKADG